MRDFVRSGFEKKFYRCAQSRHDTVRVRARLEFSPAAFEFYLTLRDEIRRNDVPAADDRWPQQIASAFLYVENPGARGSEHPFLRAGAEKIDVPQRDRKNAERLDRIDG